MGRPCHRGADAGKLLNDRAVFADEYPVTLSNAAFTKTMGISPLASEIAIACGDTREIFSRRPISGVSGLPRNSMTSLTSGH